LSSSVSGGPATTGTRSRRSRMPGKVLVVDVASCNGCWLCVAACSQAHGSEQAGARSRLSVYGCGPDQYTPATCQNCESPACAGACPTKACHREPGSGRVVIDEERCIGCKTCTVACPFGHPFFDEGPGVSLKCDYCDGSPACAAVCDRGAIVFVDSDEASTRKRRREALARDSRS
jgi:Fe-S-cluster-containing dehydrogenase component